MFCNLTVDFGGVNFPLPYKKPNTIYIGFVSVFSGCTRAKAGHPCPDCQNPSLWEHVVTPQFCKEDITRFVSRKMKIFREIHKHSNVVYFYSILGGEPLDQLAEELEEIHKMVQQGVGHPIPTVLFSGYPHLTLADRRVQDYVAVRVNYLKLGPYLGNQHRKLDLSSGLATENQEWLVINKW